MEHSAREHEEQLHTAPAVLQQLQFLAEYCQNTIVAQAEDQRHLVENLGHTKEVVRKLVADVDQNANHLVATDLTVQRNLEALSKMCGKPLALQAEGHRQ